MRKKGELMSESKTITIRKQDGTSTEVSLTEDEAIDLLVQFREVFGWSGTEFTRKDIENTLGRPLTDSEWEKVRYSREWDTTLIEQVCSAGFWVVDLVISDVLEVE